MRNLFILGFVVMAVAQWYVPVSMIRGAHEIINEGVEYRFKTQPIDPSDPFRGKYVTLTFDAETYNPADTNELHFEGGQEIYATIAPDSADFMSVTRLTADPPEPGTEYLQVTFSYSSPRYVYDYGDGKIESKAFVNVRFPFNRLYVEESKASEAEHLYWSTRIDSTSVCYAKVRIYNGKATLVDVMINDRPIMDIVREMNTSQD